MMYLMIYVYVYWPASKSSINKKYQHAKDD